MGDCSPPRVPQTELRYIRSTDVAGGGRAHDAWVADVLDRWLSTPDLAAGALQGAAVSRRQVQETGGSSTWSTVPSIDAAMARGTTRSRCSCAVAAPTTGSVTVAASRTLTSPGAATLALIAVRSSGCRLRTTTAVAPLSESCVERDRSHRRNDNVLQRRVMHLGCVLGYLRCSTQRPHGGPHDDQALRRSSLVQR
jgi:hypothetical protein